MSGDKEGCPVTDKGCPPVITLMADMKWVKRWLKVVTVNTAFILLTLLGFLANAYVDSLQQSASADTPTEIVVDSASYK